MFNWLWGAFFGRQTSRKIVRTLLFKTCWKSNTFWSWCWWRWCDDDDDHDDDDDADDDGDDSFERNYVSWNSNLVWFGGDLGADVNENDWPLDKVDGLTYQPSWKKTTFTCTGERRRRMMMMMRTWRNRRSPKKKSPMMMMLQMLAGPTEPPQLVRRLMCVMSSTSSSSSPGHQKTKWAEWAPKYSHGSVECGYI